MARRYSKASYFQTLIAAVLCLASLPVSVTRAEEPTQTLNAEGMTIYGQRELPKVMYIVPWKKTEAADIDKPTTGSLVADVLDTVDPELFQRQIQYHDLMQRTVTPASR